MPILNNIANAFLGATQVSAIYRGAEKIWPSFTGLLDLYPNAAVAYSLRRLRSGYTGSAIRVRRSSDNAEQDIGFVDNVLDTASLLTFVGAGDGFVTTWYDQSGLGSDATQTTAGVQPEIVLGGVLWEQNGKPAVRFLDNSGSAVLDRLNVPVFHTASVDYLAYFVTYSLRINGSNPYVIGSAAVADQGMTFLNFNNTRQIRPYNQRVSGASFANGSALNLLQQYIITHTSNRVRLRAHINNVLNIDVADRNSDFVMPSVSYSLGNIGNNVVQGDSLISEFVAYARDVEAEISGINTNTNTFYGAY
jgi:hypothetical protein